MILYVYFIHQFSCTLVGYKYGDGDGRVKPLFGTDSPTSPSAMHSCVLEIGCTSGSRPLFIQTAQRHGGERKRVTLPARAISFSWICRAEALNKSQ